MKEKSDRTAYIKKALDSYGYDIYSALYSHMRFVVSVKTALSRIVAPGGGGTNYQPAVEYAIRNRYDALVYLTDGEATIPAIPKPFISRVLWCSPDGRI